MRSRPKTHLCACLRPALRLQATKNLERAKKEWDGEPEELAQVGCAGTG